MTKATRWMVSTIALLVLASPAAVAQEWVEGWYAEFGGGLAVQSNTGVNRTGVNSTMESDLGYILSGALGRQYRNVHVEFEALFMENGFNQISGGGTSVKISGDTTVFGAMASVYYDFDFGGSWRPFLGGGVGLVQVGFNDVSAPGFFDVDDEDEAIAWQLRAGISYSLTRFSEFVVNYRYLMSEDLDIPDSTGTAVSTDGIRTHGVEARLRIRY